MAVGSGIGGKLMQFGRRRALLIISVCGVIGVSLALVSITAFYVLMLGRFMYGVCSGLFGATLPRYIEEYLPLDYYTIGALVFVVSQNIGSCLGMYDGLLLPREYNNPDYHQQLVDYSDWRYIFGFPFLLFTILIIQLLFFIRSEGPKFYIVRGQKEIAIRVIHDIYETKGDDQLA